MRLKKGMIINTLVIDIVATFQFVICPLLLVTLVPVTVDMVVRVTKGYATGSLRQLSIAVIESLWVMGILAVFIVGTTYAIHHDSTLQMMAYVLDYLGFFIGVILVVYRNHH